MEMYLLICVTNRSRATEVQASSEEAGLPIAFSTPASGTATEQHLTRYGLRRSHKVAWVALGDAARSKAFTRLVRRKLILGIPGNGFVCRMPLKSVGGSLLYDYLVQSASTQGGVPTMEFDHELIVVVANRDYGDAVMNAARPAGATGGTVVHAKGTGAQLAHQFLNVSLATEKEVILIIAKSEDKSAIMQAIVEMAGPTTPAGAICFSCPVSEVHGLTYEDDAEE